MVCRTISPETSSSRSAPRGEPFSRDRLFLSLYESLRHRTTAVQDAAALADTIMTRLFAGGDAMITREHIVSACRDALEHFDQPAWVHYDAFHPL
ncbi:hypothetical protein CR970_04440 [Candidatus Saccharibacteria bacterium]|nr:MAG: hypothetical protein CR970_04440 [Candidatus Saccharibacteria bacterium]